MRKVKWKLSVGSGVAGKDYLVGIIEVPENYSFWDITDVAENAALENVNITWDWAESEGEANETET